MKNAVFTLLLFFIFNVKNGFSQIAFNPDSVNIAVMTYPEFQAKYFDIQGDSTLIVNFWASWCKPCRLEMPYFEQLRQENVGKKVKILLVTIDKAEHVEAKAKPFLILNEISVESITVQDKVSPLKWIPLICPDWAGSIPLTLVMNKDDGTYFETSFVSFEQLKKAVLPYIK
jgi:thiol-disulfide isomerase/thioredoxin